MLGKGVVVDLFEFDLLDMLDIADYDGTKCSLIVIMSGSFVIFFPPPHFYVYRSWRTVTGLGEILRDSEKQI